MFRVLTHFSVDCLLALRYAYRALAILPSFVFRRLKSRRLLHCLCNLKGSCQDTHNIWGFFP